MTHVFSLLFLRKVEDTCHSWPSSEKANHSKFSFKQGLGGANPEPCFFQMVYEGATCSFLLLSATWHCRSHPEEAPHVHSPFLQGQPPFEIQIPPLRWRHLRRLLQTADTCQNQGSSWNCHMSASPFLQKSRNLNSSEVAQSASSIPVLLTCVKSFQRRCHMACSYWFQLYTSEALLRWRHSRTPLSSLLYLILFILIKVAPWGGAIWEASEKPSLNFKLQENTSWGGAIWRTPAEKIKQTPILKIFKFCWGVSPTNFPFYFLKKKIKIAPPEMAPHGGLRLSLFEIQIFSKILQIQGLTPSLAQIFF